VHVCCYLPCAWQLWLLELGDWWRLIIVIVHADPLAEVIRLAAAITSELEDACEAAGAAEGLNVMSKAAIEPLVEDPTQCATTQVEHRKSPQALGSVHAALPS
jgi:hypothetical protein